MSNRAIIEAINKIVKGGDSQQVFYVSATVDSVDLDERTCVCTVVEGETEYELPDVSLMASVDDGILFEPAIDSVVKLIFSLNIDPFICQFSELANITFVAGTQIQMNGGEFGGLTKTQELKSQLDIVTSRIDTVYTAIENGVPVAQDGGAGYQTSMVALLQTQVQKEDFSDIENDDITHGEKTN